MLQDVSNIQITSSLHCCPWMIIGKRTKGTSKGERFRYKLLLIVLA